MTKSRFPGLFVLCSLLLGQTPGLMAGIYKWTDEDGNVVYGDSPPARTAKEIKIRRTPTMDQSYQQRLDKRQKLLDTFNEERADKLAREKQIAEQNALQAERCQRIRADLSRMQSASFLYEETGDPLNPSILTDEQRRQEQQRYQAYLDENC